MLIALVAVSIFGAGGWILAWHARGEALEALYAAEAARAAERIAESKTSGIRLSAASLRNAMADAESNLAVERVRSSSLQLELATARADLADFAAAPSMRSTARGEELYDSTTRRLRIPAALARASEP